MVYTNFFFFCINLLKKYIYDEEKKKKTRTLIEVEGKKVSYEISNCLFQNETLVVMDNDKSDNKQGGTN